MKPTKRPSRRAAKVAAPSATFSSVLAELAGAFENRKRDDGTTFVCIADNAPAWTRNEIAGGPSGLCLMLRIHSAVDDRGPDDWIYQHTALAAAKLTDYSDSDTTAESLRDKGTLHEVADGLVDIYNVELTKWLALHLYNVELCNEAVEEMGAGSAGGVLGYIQAGQYRALEAIASAIVSEVERELESRG